MPHSCSSRFCLLAYKLPMKSTAGCIFALFIQFFLVQHLALRQRIEVSEQLLHSRQDQYRISEETIEYLNLIYLLWDERRFSCRHLSPLTRERSLPSV